MKHHERREEFGKGGALENRGPIHVETLDDLGVGWGADHAGGPLARIAKRTSRAFVSGQCPVGR
jgi:hypothetical protein